jgi:transposase
MIDPSRSRSVPKFIFGLDNNSDNIKKSKGILNCDRWTSYQKLYGILTAFCWAHVRRDFIDLMKKYPYKLYEWGKI